MPLWAIHYSPGSLTQQDKQSIAEKVTKLYTNAGMPAFYVQVRFSETPADSQFTGGTLHTNFAGIEIYHVARELLADRFKRAFLNAADAILTPLFQSKGMDWEYFVQESPRDLWKINGIIPPPTGSELEKKWFRENRPSANVSFEKL